jgi:hypothetical protein
MAAMAMRLKKEGKPWKRRTEADRLAEMRANLLKATHLKQEKKS